MNVPMLNAIIGDDGRGVSHKATLVVGFRRVVFESGEEENPEGELVWEAGVVVKDAAGNRVRDGLAEMGLFARTFEGAVEAVRRWYIDTGYYIAKKAVLKRKGEKIYLHIDCDRFVVPDEREDVWPSD